MTYEKAMAELIELENTDVITTSGETSSEWCGEPNENGWGGGEVDPGFGVCPYGIW